MKPLYEQVRADWDRTKNNVTYADMTPFSWLAMAGGGLDEFGHPVFEEADDFEAATRHLVEQNRDEFGLLRWWGADNQP